MLTRIVSVALMALTLTAEAEGKLVPVGLDELVEQSDVIVRGRMVSGSVAEAGSGRATLKVVDVIKGVLDSNQAVELTWSSEVHDQSIDRLGHDYVLFLAVRGGRLVPAIYGRSYWLLENLETPDGFARDVVKYEYPVSMVEVSDSQLDWVTAIVNRHGSSAAPQRFPVLVLRLSTLLPSIAKGVMNTSGRPPNPSLQRTPPVCG